MELDSAKELIKTGVKFHIVLPMVPKDEHKNFREWYVQEKSVPNLKDRQPEETFLLKEVSGLPKDRELIITDHPCHVCGYQEFIPGPCPTCANCGESSKGCG